MINSRLLLVVVDGKKVYIDDNDADLFDNDEEDETKTVEGNRDHSTLCRSRLFSPTGIKLIQH